MRAAHHSTMSWADLLADRSARRWLHGIARRLDSGWLALTGDRLSLWPAFESHTSAVIDAVRCESELVPREEPVTDLVLLAAHAHDVWTRAVADGWTPPATVG